MILNITNLLDDYYKLLRDKTTFVQVEDCIEITTPYLDRHNDYIQIYLKQEEDFYVLTDDSWNINNLEQSGYSLASRKNREALELILNAFGIQKDKNEIFIKTNCQNFALNKHKIMQAILAVNNIYNKRYLTF